MRLSLLPVHLISASCWKWSRHQLPNLSASEWRLRRSISVYLKNYCIYVSSYVYMLITRVPAEAKAIGRLPQLFNNRRTGGLPVAHLGHHGASVDICPSSATQPENDYQVVVERLPIKMTIFDCQIASDSEQFAVPEPVPEFSQCFLAWYDATTRSGNFGTHYTTVTSPSTPSERSSDMARDVRRSVHGERLKRSLRLWDATINEVKQDRKPPVRTRDLNTAIDEFADWFGSCNERAYTAIWAICFAVMLDISSTA